MGVQFLNHILLSLGRFETEIDLMMHPIVRECFRYAKLIGPADDEESLQSYSYKLSELFIKVQLRYFPNSMRVLQQYIVISRELFDSTIVHDELPVTEMSPVQLSTLLSMRDEVYVQFRQTSKSNIITACFNELGALVQTFNVPLREDLLNAKINKLNWNPIENLKQSET